MSRKERRFSFGKNWRRYLDHLTEERISIAEQHLRMVLTTPLSGKTFLDVGCGSGLFSLCARNLGAKVHAFDYDLDAVECAESIRRTYSEENDFLIEQGSILDPDFLSTLGKFDIVYSYGVLHHAGNMRQALANIAELPKEDGGVLYLALYNKHRTSHAWKRIKEYYNRGPISRFFVRVFSYTYFISRRLIISTIRMKNSFVEYKRDRGMSFFTDIEDWIGGYPYEFASIDEIVSFFCDRDFLLKYIKTNTGTGNNEYTFIKVNRAAKGLSETRNGSAGCAG